MSAAKRSILRWLFRDETTRTRYPDWEHVAASTVASEEFARYWAGYRLFKLTHGTERLFHPTVGVLTLNYETIVVPNLGGQNPQRDAIPAERID